MTRAEKIEQARRAVEAAVQEIVNDAASRGELEYAADLAEAIRCGARGDEWLLEAVRDLLLAALRIKDRQERIEYVRDEGARVLRAARERGIA